MIKKLSQTILLTMMIPSLDAYGLYLDGKGHYSIRGETRVAPGMSGDRGLFQAVDQNFSLMGEARVNDKSSFFMELKLFEDERQAYLGDQSNPERCQPVVVRDPNSGAETKTERSDCRGTQQDTSFPQYSPYIPRITKAYAKFGFEYCIVEAGRRGRDWGMGLLLDSGEDPFETSASVFDGITCNVNIHRSQTLGFAFGYDKLSETGADLGAFSGEGYGAKNPTDDLDQIFLAVEYDNRKTAGAGSFSRKVGVYVANVLGPNTENNGGGTDVKFFDLYTAFYASSFTFKNEILFRTGKSADPSYWFLGGAQDDAGEYANNDVNAFAIAGSLQWALASSITNVHAEDYGLGKGYRHLLFFDYAFAPGSSQGYYSEYNRNGVGDGNELPEGVDQFERSSKAEAFAFHRNFKPALLLFNGRKEIDDLKVDGAFDPGRLINATVMSLGYRYEELNGHNFEAKLISAQMSEGMPSEVKAYYEANPSLERPAGYYGSSIGYELDLKYSVKVGQQADLGVAGAYVWAGDAWKTSEDKDVKNASMIQTYLTFRF